MMPTMIHGYDDGGGTHGIDDDYFFCLRLQCRTSSFFLKLFF